MLRILAKIKLRRKLLSHIKRADNYLTLGRQLTIDCYVKNGEKCRECIKKVGQNTVP